MTRARRRARGPCRAVAPRAVGVARQLATDRRRATAQPRGDRADLLAAGAPQRDLLALSERQTAAFEIAAAARTHTTGLTQPRQPAMAVRTGERGRLGEELPGLQRGPERLDRLGDQRIRETNGHQHPPPASTFTRRSRGPLAPHARSAPIAATPRPRARLRDDRRATQARATDAIRGSSRSRQCCDHRENPRVLYRHSNPRAHAWTRPRCRQLARVASMTLVGVDVATTRSTRTPAA